jgi:GxxExxY protein
MLHEKHLTELIIRLFYRVYDGLGFGFLESVYREALAYEFTRNGLLYKREAGSEVGYEVARVGRFRADFLVEDRIVVEVKATRLLSDADTKQLLNELRCSDKEVGLLLHFGPKAKFHRMIYTNDRKPARAG